MASTQLQTLQDKLLAEALCKTIREFLDYLTVEAGLAENTRLAYGRDLINFAEYCAGQNVKEIKQIEPGLIYNYAPWWL